MILTEAVVSALVSRAETERDRLIMLVLWSTGCRVSELTALRPRDFKPAKRALTLITLKKRVKRTCKHCGKRVSKSHQHCPSCGERLVYAEQPLVSHKTRTFILPPDVSRRLAAYARKVRGERLFPLTRQAVYNMVRRVAEKAGYGGMVMRSAEQSRAHYLHPHNFREAFATHWFEKRDDTLGQKALQALLGHERFETTARYAKMTPQRVQEVYDDVMGIEEKDRKGQAEGLPEEEEEVPWQAPAPAHPLQQRKRALGGGRGEMGSTSPRPATLADMRAFLQARKDQA
ncbi:MAG: tyrosine-type recombinase/integrase [Chloroflexota bacterium]|nr:tyrosine-type recombinase/integrase [Chloroflexota bacterium]